MEKALDRIDNRIVAALQNDGRLSNKELAARVELAPSSCLERVKRLRQRGIIQGVHAEVDPAALGIGLQAILLVRLRRHSRSAVASFHEHALSLREVVALYNVTGAEDFLVHVVARDMQHLYDLARDGFAGSPEVDHLQTSLIFNAVRRPVLPNLAEPEPEAAPAPARARVRKKRSRR
ncbi:MAG TPA: Lrp/AsnC family transcriptional regulator [Myxococcus sp.]|nr:Lrp/AsnC family transcriptional regulator [Myxococcus sp.]